MNALIFSLVLIVHLTYSAPLAKETTEDPQQTTTPNVFETTNSPVTEMPPKSINSMEHIKDKEELHEILGPSFNAFNSDIGDMNHSMEKQNIEEYLGLQTPLIIKIPIYIYIVPGKNPQIFTEKLQNIYSYGSVKDTDKGNKKFLTSTANFNRLPLEEDDLEISIPFQRETNRHRSANRSD